MTSETTRIPLASIVADDTYQPRVEGLSARHLALLAESDAADWPPLLVTPRGDGRYNILDGFHRHADAQRRKLPDLPCCVVEGAGYPEAFEANRDHGLPLSIQDRREYAVWLRDEHPDWSLRQIGRACGLSHHTVAAALRADNGQSAQPSTAHSKPSHIERMVRLLISAADSGEGRILGLFGDRRAQHVAAVLAQYTDTDRPAVAKMLDAWGNACVEAAKPYLSAQEPKRISS